MDFKVSLARQEEERRAVLLASTGTGENAKRALRGGKRQKISRNVKGNAGGETINTSPQSKSNAEDKGRDRRGRRPGRNYSLRQAVGETKRRNLAGGRSAQELGIEWLDARCEDSPITKAHWLLDKTNISNGVIFECKFCHRVKWLPVDMDTCSKLGNLMKVYGNDLGYQKMLNERPQAKRLMSKIQDIYYLRKSVPEDQFLIAVAAVMLDREYPYDVELVEKEVL